MPDKKSLCPADPSARAKEYQAKRHWLILWGILLQTGGLLFVGLSGLTFFLKSMATALCPHPAGTVVLYFLFFSIFFLLVDIPFDFYSGYWLERRYNLTNHRIGTWALESAKKSLLAFAFYAVLIEALYLLIREFPAAWWILAWAGWIAVNVLLGKVAHVLILPLFYKCERAEDAPLREKLGEMFLKFEFPVKEIYRINLSKTTKKANAAFAGFGRTRRILLADTLLLNFTRDEIVSVVAHELGHAKRKHLAKGIVFSAGVSLAVFFLAFKALGALAIPPFFANAADIAAFPILGLVAIASGLLLMPLSNLVSRHYEREADDFALREVESPEVFASALKKLGNMNLADFEPHPLIEFILFSHPSIGKRIRHAQSIKK